MCIRDRDRDAMEEFLLNIKLLAGTLGHKFLEEKSFYRRSDDIALTNEKVQKSVFQNNKNIELFLNVKGIKATALQTNEGIVVLENSEVSNNPTKNYGYGTLREKLIKEGVIRENKNKKLVFIKDYLFSSVSAAAAVIVGYSINGRNSWKNNEGISINEIEESQIR